MTFVINMVGNSNFSWTTGGSSMLYHPRRLRIPQRGNFKLMPRIYRVHGDSIDSNRFQVGLFLLKLYHNCLIHAIYAVPVATKHFIL